MRFVEQQLIARRWIAFVDLTDWCAQSTTAADVDEEKKAKDLAYRRLADSVLNGAFEKNGRSKILYLDPSVMDDGASPRRRLTREQFKIAFEDTTMPPAPSLPFAVLNCCWLPRERAQDWLESRGYRRARHFEPVAAAADELISDAGRIPRGSDVDQRQPAEGAAAAGSSPAGAIPPNDAQLEEWIFARGALPPRERTSKKLYEAARQEPRLGTFKKADFLAAYGSVYATEPHAPPATGWPLQPAYAKRAKKQKSSK